MGGGIKGRGARLTIQRERATHAPHTLLRAGSLVPTKISRIISELCTPSIYASSGKNRSFWLCLLAATGGGGWGAGRWGGRV